MYRKEWKAVSSNIDLNVFPIHDALVGIKIPPGINEIQINYENILLKTLNFISFFVLLFLILSLPLSYLIKRRRYKSD